MSALSVLMNFYKKSRYFIVYLFGCVSTLTLFLVATPTTHAVNDDCHPVPRSSEGCTAETGHRATSFGASTKTHNAPEANNTTSSQKTRLQPSDSCREEGRISSSAGEQESTSRRVGSRTRQSVRHRTRAASRIQSPRRTLVVPEPLAEVTQVTQQAQDHEMECISAHEEGCRDRRSVLLIVARRADIDLDFCFFADPTSSSASLKAHELSRMWRNEWNSMTAEEQTALTEDAVKELEEQRESRNLSAQNTAISAFNDASAVLSRIEEEVSLVLYIQDQAHSSIAGLPQRSDRNRDTSRVRQI